MTTIINTNDYILTVNFNGNEFLIQKNTVDIAFEKPDVFLRWNPLHSHPMNKREFKLNFEEVEIDGYEWDSAEALAEILNSFLFNPSVSDITQPKIINTTAGNSATINARSGRFRKQNGSGTDFTLINSYIDANSIVLISLASAPGATGYDAPIIVAGAGQAIIYFKTAAAAAVPANNTDVNFFVVN